MVEIKEMPFKDKYEACVTGAKALDYFALPLVKERLGDSKVDELKSMMQRQAKPILDQASYEEKYELAYGNWMREWQSAYDFVGKELGDNGKEEFVRRAVDYWKKKTASPALHILSFVRAIAPKTAFRMTAKQLAYQWQVFMPFSISEFNDQRMVLTASHCKTLDYEGCEDTCTVACQKLIPLWWKEQFKVRMTPVPAGESCTITITPL
jgi:hypothetical protein